MNPDPPAREPLAIAAVLITVILWASAFVALLGGALCLAGVAVTRRAR